MKKINVELTFQWGRLIIGSVILKYYFLIYFLLCWLFIPVLGLFLVAVSGGYSLAAVHGASHCRGFTFCGALAVGTQASVLSAHGL